MGPPAAGRLLHARTRHPGAEGKDTQKPWVPGHAVARAPHAHTPLERFLHTCCVGLLARALLLPLSATSNLPLLPRTQPLHPKPKFNRPAPSTRPPQPCPPAEPRMIASQALAPSALAAAWSRDSSLSGLPPYLHHPGGPGPATLSMQQPHSHLCSAPHVVTMPLRFWPPSPAIMSDNALLQSGNGMPPPPLDASERPVGMCHAYINPYLRAGSTYPDMEAEAAAAAAAAAAASAATASVRTSVGGSAAVTAAELAAEMAASLRSEDLVPGRPPVIPKREHGQQQQQQSVQPAGGDKGGRGVGPLRPPHALLQLSINPDPSAPASGAEGRGGSACTSPLGRSPLSPSSRCGRQPWHS